MKQLGDVGLAQRACVVIAALLAAGAGVSGAASARDDRGQRARPEARYAPVKECTRFNGRYGYYGNPWCTPREQAAWDAWSAGRRWWR